MTAEEGPGRRVRKSVERARVGRSFSLVRRALSTGVVLPCLRPGLKSLLCLKSSQMPGPLSTPRHPVSPYPLQPEPLARAWTLSALKPLRRATLTQGLGTPVLTLRVCVCVACFKHRVKTETQAR